MQGRESHQGFTLDLTMTSNTASIFQNKRKRHLQKQEKQKLNPYEINPKI